MARIECESHGLQGTEAMCFHVQSAALNDRAIQFSAVCGDDFFLPCVWLCNECKMVWDGITTEEAKEEYLGTVKMMCGRCFDEWKDKNLKMLVNNEDLCAT